MNAGTIFILCFGAALLFGIIITAINGEPPYPPAPKDY